MSNDNSIESFRRQLENEYEWPALYTFKFIVPKDKIGDVRALFIKHDVSERESSKGAYISLTSRVMAESSEHIIDIYIKANEIEGIIAL
jgi:putative lipoic acid-binding regulatory protein